MMKAAPSPYCRTGAALSVTDPVTVAYPPLPPRSAASFPVEFIEYMRNPDTLPSADADTTQPRLNRRQAAKVRTRQKVLDAARALFAERGYDAATIRDIAKEAGMSTGAVFANFQDKAELFEAVLSQDMAKLADILKGGVVPDAPVRERLLGAISAGYHATLDQLPLIQAVVARSWFQPQAAELRIRVAVKDLVMVISDALQSGIGKGELKQDTDVRLVSELVWDAFLSNFRRAAYDGWTLEQLTARAGKQVDVILAGAVARQ
tara:strand:- start:362 stop:1150 length:789 start_codon:yes stop_codon:yes gene_type:complete